MPDLQNTDILVYQTSDPKFANLAIKALYKAGIACSHYGAGAANLRVTLGNWTDKQIYIYIHSEHDVDRANQILLDLGAAVNKPMWLPGRLIVFGVAVLVVLMVLVLK